MVKSYADNRKNRTIRVNGRRTSLRVCLQLWSALEDIAVKEGMTLSELVAEVDTRRGKTGLTIALRIFALSYLRAAATPYLENTAPADQPGLSVSAFQEFGT